MRARGRGRAVVFVCLFEACEEGEEAGEGLERGEGGRGGAEPFFPLSLKTSFCVSEWDA